MLNLLLDQTSGPATETSSGFFGGASCFVCAAIGIGILILLFVLSSRLQAYQVKKNAAAAVRGIHEEQVREQNEGGPKA